MSARIVTFGEIMLRLKSPGFERLFQSPTLEATFGGGEANVAVSCANYGMDASFVTVLPDNDVARACARELRGFGVDTRDIVYTAGRMGIYFVESSFTTARAAPSPRPGPATSTGKRPSRAPRGSTSPASPPPFPTARACWPLRA